MQTEHTKIVLSKLIELTRERDVNSLEFVLAKALFELVTPNSVTIYRVIDFENLKFSARLMGESTADEVIPEKLETELVGCLNAGVHRVYVESNNTNFQLYPLLSYKNYPVAVVSVQSDHYDLEMHTITSMLLEIYQNFITLINDNERDTLTGLLNRKTFEIKVSKILGQLQSASLRKTDAVTQKFYLAIFDIDHFKRVNDEFGHLIGDEVLLLFSRLLSNSFRDKDMIFRFGGEEFVTVFDCPDLQHMQMVLSRFKDKVQKYEFPQVGKVTVSIGFTEIVAYDNFAKVIDRADTALYYSKNNGRNRLSFYEDLIESGELTANKLEGEVELF